MKKNETIEERILHRKNAFGEVLLSKSIHHPIRAK